MTVRAVRGLTSLSGRDPVGYGRHALHAEGRSYLEKEQNRATVQLASMANAV